MNTRVARYLATIVADIRIALLVSADSQALQNDVSFCRGAIDGLLQSHAITPHESRLWLEKLRSAAKLRPPVFVGVASFQSGDGATVEDGSPELPRAYSRTLSLPTLHSIERFGSVLDIERLTIADSQMTIDWSVDSEPDVEVVFADLLQLLDDDLGPLRDGYTFQSRFSVIDRLRRRALYHLSLVDEMDNSQTLGNWYLEPRQLDDPIGATMTRGSHTFQIDSTALGSIYKLIWLGGTVSFEI